MWRLESDAALCQTKLTGFWTCLGSKPADDGAVRDTIDRNTLDTCRIGLQHTTLLQFANQITVEVTFFYFN